LKVERVKTILLVEDSPGDVRLTQEAFRDTGAAVQLHVAVCGARAFTARRLVRT
jgi:CheY-like chemotaxis protein